jgi:hypothetical protein
MGFFPNFGFSSFIAIVQSAGKAASAVIRYATLAPPQTGDASASQNTANAIAR